MLAAFSHAFSTGCLIAFALHGDSGGKPKTTKKKWELKNWCRKSTGSRGDGSKPKEKKWESFWWSYGNIGGAGTTGEDDEAESNTTHVADLNWKKWMFVVQKSFIAYSSDGAVDAKKEKEKKTRPGNLWQKTLFIFRSFRSLAGGAALHATQDNFIMNYDLRMPTQTMCARWRSQDAFLGMASHSIRIAFFSSLVGLPCRSRPGNGST